MLPPARRGRECAVIPGRAAGRQVTSDARSQRWGLILPSCLRARGRRALSRCPAAGEVLGPALLSHLLELFGC
jgi:hypothetical protein